MAGTKKNAEKPKAEPGSETAKNASKTGKKVDVKVRPESIKLEIFGDMMKFSKKSAKEILPLKKYDALAMHLLNEERAQRVMIYLFLCGLALSAAARRTTEVEKRREIFELKNRVFLAIANKFELRKVLNFRFCVSKRFKVTRYCDECNQRNAEEGKHRREWTFCQNCEVDRTYYNVLSMFHKFKGGGVSLYLGKEHIQLVHGLKPVKHVDLDDLPEQLSYENFRFTPHNLVSLDLASVFDVTHKLLTLFEKLALPLHPYGQGGDGARGRPPFARGGNTRDGARAPRPYSPRPEGKDFPPKKS
jgi:hypothetical protein